MLPSATSTATLTVRRMPIQTLVKSKKPYECVFLELCFTRGLIFIPYKWCLCQRSWVAWCGALFMLVPLVCLLVWLLLHFMNIFCWKICLCLKFVDSWFNFDENWFTIQLRKCETLQEFYCFGGNCVEIYLNVVVYCVSLWIGIYGVVLTGSSSGNGFGLWHARQPVSKW